MRVNTAVASPQICTHEGGRATPTDAFHELKRTVLTCLLFEGSFYEDKFAPAKRIVDLVPRCTPEQVAALAVEARDRMNLRSVPLFLVRQLARIQGQGPLVRETLAHIIQRPDELSEFLALYWQDGKQPLTRGVKCGLAKAFTKFDPYRLSKWNRDNKIKLRDVLFMSHAKPLPTTWDNQKDGRSVTQTELWKKLVEGTLESPDTWEVALSSKADKRETFERLIREDMLPGMALLRNLRGMQEAGVNRELLDARLRQGAKRAFPYRFVVAAKYAPTYEEAIEAGMFKAIEDLEALPGKTGLLIDVSASMDAPVGARPALTKLSEWQDKDPTSRIDVAAGLAILLREKAQEVRVATFSEYVVEIPGRRGFALRDAIRSSQPHSNTYLGAATAALAAHWAGIDRLIIITDEQSSDGISAPMCPLSYVINVASYEHGVSYRNGYQHIDGWSERCIDYIQEIELLRKEESLQSEAAGR